MTEAEIKDIALGVLREVGISISAVVRFKPEMKTKEVCQYLDCDRKWLYRNKDVFGGKIINRRNDYAFDTDKVVNYKLKMVIQ